MSEEELLVGTSFVFKRETDELQSDKICWVKGTSGTGMLYEHSTTLQEIFLGLNAAEYRERFLEYLSLIVVNSNENSGYNYDTGGYREYSSCPLAFFTLVKLGFADRAIDALSKRKKKIGLLCKLINDMVSDTISYFSILQIAKLLSAIEARDSTSSTSLVWKNAAEKNLASLGYNGVKKQLSKVSIEINKDKEELKKLIFDFGFDEKYNLLLTEIDVFINTESKTLSSAMIGNLRTFFSDLVIDMAKKSAAIEKDDIPKNPDMQEIGNCRIYLKQKLELSDAENSLVNQFVTILHAEGGHSFVSNKEYFRLARNICVEIALFLVWKYKSKYAKKK